MKIIKKTLPKNHNLFLFGDDHEGTILRHDEGWEQLIDMMNSEYDGCKNNFGVDHGDIIDAIPASDPRWYELTERDKFLHQINKAVENREKIKDKLVLILDGNHPMKYWRLGDATEEICRRLGVPYGTYSAHITYTHKNGAVMYRHYATHGRKNIGSTADDPVRQDANKKLQLKRHLKNKFADCVLETKGHTHKLIICRPTCDLYLNASTKISQHYTKSKQTDTYIPPDLRWYVNTGSFLRLFVLGVSGYAEVAEYDPMELGFAIAKIRDGIIVDIDKVVLETQKNQEVILPEKP